MKPEDYADRGWDAHGSLTSYPGLCTVTAQPSAAGPADREKPGRHAQLVAANTEPLCSVSNAGKCLSGGESGWFPPQMSLPALN